MTTPPASVLAAAAGAPIELVWTNDLGGMTFTSGDRFIKWSPISLEAERIRLAWAIAHTAVPKLVDAGFDDHGWWLVTEALPGVSAVDARWKNDPATAVRAIGSGLRALHDALPVETCPFSWSIADRRTEIGHRIPHPERWHADHRDLDVATAIRQLADPPPIDRLVVCHGDSCAPNTIIGDDGHCVGHVDLGALGVADRWADLAIATWSAGWNYGQEWEKPLLDTYGVTPDDERIRYYRLLWDLGP